MSEAPTMPPRAEPVPVPENIRSSQPGGGFCYRVEMAWGRWRRWCLKRLRRGYVRRMAERRRGSTAGAPHEILDSRDLKFCRNLCTCHWDTADDRFRWRSRIPLARWGLAEVQIMGWPLVALAALPALVVPEYWYAGAVPVVVFLWLLYFFRDPYRRIPAEVGLLVAPADGKVVEIARLEHDEFVGGPAVRIGVFLSIFSVHINRVPARCRVIELRYTPGKFLNALRPESARENEAVWIGLEETSPPHRRIVVRQIAGAIARRIVCTLRPGEVVDRGDQFGMIKLGSRTELIISDDESLSIEVEVGRRIKAGNTIVARYNS